MLVASLRPPGWVVGFGFTEAGTPTRPHRLCWGRVCYGMQRCSSLLSRVLCSLKSLNSNPSFSHGQVAQLLNRPTGRSLQPVREWDIRSLIGPVDRRIFTAAHPRRAFRRSILGRRRPRSGPRHRQVRSRDWGSIWWTCQPFDVVGEFNTAIINLDLSRDCLSPIFTYREDGRTGSLKTRATSGRPG